MKYIQIEKFERKNSIAKMIFYFLLMMAYAVWGPGEF